MAVRLPPNTLISYNDCNAPARAGGGWVETLGKRRVRQFISEVFDAPNVLTIPVDTKVVDEFAPLVHAPLDRSRFVCVRPPWNSDVRWISACHEESFELFQSAFDRLGIAEAVAASAAMGR